MTSRKSARRQAGPHSPHHRAQHSGARRASHSNTSTTASSTTLFAGVTDNALANVLAVLIAKNVSVITTNGAMYNGYFSTTEGPSSNHPLNIVLRYATIAKPSPPPSQSLIKVLNLRGTIADRILIPLSLVSVIRAAPLQSYTPSTHLRDPDTSHKALPFGTDADISHGAPGTTRQLRPFQHFSGTQPDSSSSKPEDASTLDELTFGDLAISAVSSSEKWDQFQVNQDKFGVTTSFDENEYTTKLDREGPHYHQRELQAARIASEIENDISHNVHILEERNHTLAEDFSEEDRFSGVTRIPHVNQTEPVRVQSDPPPRPSRPLSYAAAAAAGNARAIAGLRPAGNKGLAPSRQPSQKSISGSQQAKPHFKNDALPAKKLPSQNLKHVPATSEASEATSGHGDLKSLNTGDRNKYNFAKSSARTKGVEKVENANTGKVTSATNVSKQTNRGKQQRATVERERCDTTAVKLPSTQTGSSPNVQSSDSSKILGELELGSPSSSDGSASKNGMNVLNTPSVSEESAVRQKNGKSSNLSNSSILPHQANMSRSSISGILSPSQLRNSPTASGTSTIGVLNLDAQPPNLGPEKIKQFSRFRMERTSQVIKENRAQITHGLKEFSSKLDSKNNPLRRNSRSTSGTAIAIDNTDSSAVPIKSEAVEKKTTVETAKDEISVEDALSRSATEKPTDISTQEDTQPDKMEEKNSVSERSTGSENPEDNYNNGYSKAKPKGKSKLNPKAAEFKPSLPTFRKSERPVTHPYSTYPQYSQQYVPVNSMGFSQPMQTFPPGYPMPMQHMTQLPYGQPYTMMMPSPMPPTIQGAGGVQYVQGPGGMAIPMGQVPGRLQQNMPTPASYGYPQVVPIVVAQPPQRITFGGGYTQFYNGPQFLGPGGTSPISPSVQPGMFGQAGGPHGGVQVSSLHGDPNNMQQIQTGGIGSSGTGGRGGGHGNGHGSGHGGANGRRTGAGRSRGRQHGHGQHGGHQNGHVAITYVGTNSSGKDTFQSLDVNGDGTGVENMSVGVGIATGRGAQSGDPGMTRNAAVGSGGE